MIHKYFQVFMLFDFLHPSICPLFIMLMGKKNTHDIDNLTSREFRVFQYLSVNIVSVTWICGTKILQPLEGVESNICLY